MCTHEIGKGAKLGHLGGLLLELPRDCLSRLGLGLQKLEHLTHRGGRSPVRSTGIGPTRIHPSDPRRRGSAAGENA